MKETTSSFFITIVAPKKSTKNVKKETIYTCDQDQLAVLVGERRGRDRETVPCQRQGGLHL